MSLPLLIKDVQLIGIHGKAGSGKDTIGCYIAETFANCYGDSFAGPLKASAAAAFGIPLDFFYDPDMKELTLDSWGVSPRMMAQFMGTELFRNNIWKLIPGVEEDFWTHRLAKKINGQIDEVEYEDGDTVLITDVRFQNEVEFILENNGIIFHVIRDSTQSVGIPGHSSETMTLEEGLKIHKIFNIGTKEELYAQVLNELTNTHLKLHKLLK